MEICVQDKDCDKCKVYKQSIELLKSKLKDSKVIYEDSVKTYRQALTDREYELLMRECEVVKEMDTLKSIISTLTLELNKLGVNVSINGANVEVKYGKKVSKSVDSAKGKDLKVKKVDSKSVNSTIVKSKVCDKVNAKGNVKVTVKEELKSGGKEVKTRKKVINNGVLSIVLPEVLGLTDSERVILTERAKRIEDYIKTDAKKIIEGVAYPCRRLELVRKHPEFFISMMLLVEHTPKSRGSYSWTRVSNILKECDDYKLVVNKFLKDTNFKLGYLNIRNWYMHLEEVLDDDLKLK